MQEKNKTAIQDMIKWTLENAFNVTAADGTRIVAIDLEEMREKFNEWLKKEEIELKQILIDYHEFYLKWRSTVTDSSPKYCAYAFLRNKSHKSDDVEFNANVLLAEVAVLSCSRKIFENWVRENEKCQEKYICVMSERDVLGRVFKRVEKSYEWFRIENADEVEKAALLRCR